MYIKVRVHNMYVCIYSRSVASARVDNDRIVPVVRRLLGSYQSILELWAVNTHRDLPSANNYHISYQHCALYSYSSNYFCNGWTVVTFLDTVNIYLWLVNIDIKTTSSGFRDRNMVLLDLNTDAFYGDCPTGYTDVELASPFLTGDTYYTFNKFCIILNYRFIGSMWKVYSYLKIRRYVLKYERFSKLNYQ